MENVDIIPFGKYKGKTIQEVSNDSQYFEWLQNQDWFKLKYGNLYQVVINNFQEPADTPEHNKMQALFLEDKYIKYLVDNNKPETRNMKTTYYTPGKPKEKEYTSHYKIINTKIYGVRFESYGIDLIINCGYQCKYFYNSLSGQREEIIETHYHKFYIICEIKPSIGDDWPAILRQIKASSLKLDFYDEKQFVLIYDSYSGIGTSEENFIKIFENENIRVIKLDDILRRKP